MTNPDDELLVTSEGVDEGSAASTAEADGTSSDAAVEGVASGGPGTGAAAPVDMESQESRQARDAQGTGQQLQAGEG